MNLAGVAPSNDLHLRGILLDAKKLFRLQKFCSLRDIEFRVM